MVKFQITLRENDFIALKELAKLEYRDPRMQAGILIKESLVKLGVLPKKEINTNQSNEQRKA